MAHPTPVLRTRLDSVALDGLRAAVEALLGDEPVAVCSALRRWRGRHERCLPPLTRAYWDAVAPLRITVPEHPAARLLDGVLVGSVTDPVRAGDALALARSAPAATWVPLPDRDVVPELWRRALVTAAEEYWHALAAVYARLHHLVRVADRAGVDDVFAARRQTLDVLAGRVASLVQRVTGTAEAGAGPDDAPAVVARADAPTAGDPPGSAAGPRPRPAHASAGPDRTAPLPAPRHGTAPASPQPGTVAPTSAHPDDLDDTDPLPRLDRPMTVPRAGAPSVRAETGGSLRAHPDGSLHVHLDPASVRDNRYAHAIVALAFLLGATVAAVAWLYVIATRGLPF